MTQVRERGDSGHPTGRSFDAKAPKDKFRVVVFNQGTGAKFVDPDGDYDSLKLALEAAKRRASDAVVTDVYDEHGKMRGQFGESWSE